VRGDADLHALTAQGVDAAQVIVDAAVAEAALLGERLAAGAGSGVVDLEEDEADADDLGGADHLA
jgi:hypothetical protein